MTFAESLAVLLFHSSPGRHEVLDLQPQLPGTQSFSLETGDVCVSSVSLQIVHVYPNDTQTPLHSSRLPLSNRNRRIRCIFSIPCFSCFMYLEGHFTSVPIKLLHFSLQMSDILMYGV